jgi:hypothetical protein
MSRRDLEALLVWVTKELQTISGLLGKPGTKKAPVPAGKPTKKVAGKPAGSSGARPSLASTVAEILKEKKKPLSIDDLAQALQKKRKDKSQGRQLKAQLKDLFQRNPRGMFKRTKTGSYTLASNPKKKK